MKKNNVAKPQSFYDMGKLGETRSYPQMEKTYPKKEKWREDQVTQSPTC